jgi:hypothetical protein
MQKPIQMAVTLRQPGNLVGNRALVLPKSRRNPSGRPQTKRRWGNALRAGQFAGHLVGNELRQSCDSWAICWAIRWAIRWAMTGQLSCDRVATAGQLSCDSWAIELRQLGNDWAIELRWSCDNPRKRYPVHI